MKPALTPGEWATRSKRFTRHHKPLEKWLHVIGLGWHDDDKGLAVELDHEVITRTGWDRVTTRVQIETPAERHALAALALRGQPFGFTREMLAAADAVARSEATPEDMTLFRQMEENIAAPLPPEPTP